MAFLFLCTLVTLTEVTADDNPFADLFDAEFEGFFASAGIGYGITRNKAAYWDGCNDQGERVSSNSYFYKLNTEDSGGAKRMVILK